MNRWKPRITERGLVECVCFAQLVALWIAGLMSAPIPTMILASILLLVALRCWPEAKR